MSIMYKRTGRLNGGVLRGSGCATGFRPELLSYIERGLMVCLAHVRGGGGGERGHTSGQALAKRTTFSDFVTCAEHLVASGLVAPDRLACEGHYAGGLLVGTAMNMRPDLFRAAVAVDPFVDCLVALQDPPPRGVHGWSEFGNPNDPKYFDYLRSYSPVDNVRPQSYPTMLVVCGLHDPKVPFWQATKWVQHVRGSNTGHTKILLRPYTGYGRIRSLEQAFLIHQLLLQARGSSINPGHFEQAWETSRSPVGR